MTTEKHVRHCIQCSQGQAGIMHHGNLSPLCSRYVSSTVCIYPFVSVASHKPIVALHLPTLGTTILPCGLISLLVSTFSNKTAASRSAQDLAPGKVLSAADSVCPKLGASARALQGGHT